MNPIKLLDFIIRYDSRVIDPRPISQSYVYFQKLIEAGQVIWLRKKKQRIGFLTYYKVRNLEECRKTDEDWQLPKNYTDGEILFIDTCVIKPEFRNSRTIFSFRKKLFNKEKQTKKVAWVNEKNEWTKQEIPR